MTTITIKDRQYKFELIEWQTGSALVVASDDSPQIGKARIIGYGLDGEIKRAVYGKTKKWKPTRLTM